MFRTFGDDLDKIIWEFNQFCGGQHPCFSGRNGTPLVKFDGSKGTKDLRLQQMSQKALYYRLSDDLDDAKLITGVHTRISENYDVMKDALDSVEEFEDCQVHEGPIHQHQEILETLKKHSSMAIQEDLTNWKKNDEHREVAKLLLVDQADYNTLHIFFDDSAHEGEDCIVDVRDVITKEVLPYEKFINRYVIKVEPHRAILEPDYFIKMIEIAERSRDDEIDRLENGIPDEVVDEEEVEEQEDDAWAKLQVLPNDEYLQRTVLPVLYQGMKVVDRDRPEAPLEYLALYLLKH